MKRSFRQTSAPHHRIAMPGQTQLPLGGAQHRSVAPAHSTSTTEPVSVDPLTVEVIVSDGRIISRGSQWGHVAIAIDNKVYSRAHSVYYTTTLDKYLADNRYRDSTRLVLRVSNSEKQMMKSELERRVTSNGKYSLFSNNCSTNVADVLQMIGILAHDPRYFDTPVSPKELLIVVSRSKRLKKRINHSASK